MAAAASYGSRGGGYCRRVVRGREVLGREKEKGKAGKDGDKKKEAAQSIVLNVDLHCIGCASKVKRAIKHALGVESVATDRVANRVVVTGAADVVELKERIEARAKKPVQIVSASAGPPKKEKKKKAEKAGGGEKKAEKEKGSSDKEEKKPKESKEETVTLKIKLHCEGCINRIKRRIYKNPNFCSIM